MSKTISFQKRVTSEEQDRKLQDVAKKYEKHFLREMVKAMRGTVSESKLIKTNQAEAIFKEQLDDEYVEKWGDKGGIGLADMIYKQLLDQYGTSLGITRSVEKPKGPIAFDSKFKMKTSSDLVQKKLHLQFLRQTLNDFQKPNLQVSEVRAPWDGQLLGVKSLDSGEYLVEMIHDNNLKSQMTFRGSIDQILARQHNGQNIQAGQKIGLLSPEAKSMYWTIQE